MTLDEVMADLKANGSEQTKKVLIRHGAREPFFGVKVEHLKKLQKKIKKDYELSLALYDTGNSDAMYLAALIADPMKMSKAQLQKWVKAAYWHYISCFSVAWTASESRFGRELALEWMNNKKEQISAAGWATYSSLIAIKPDDELDLDEIVKLLDRVAKEIGKAPNRTKYSMNGFVIAVACYVRSLLAKAKAVAKQIGTVEVDMGETECKVPEASSYIAKLEAGGRIGKKRKSAAC